MKRIIILLFIISLIQNTYAKNGTIDWHILTALGELTGVRTERKFGYIENVDSASAAGDLIYVGGDYPFPTEDLVTTIVSSDANDTNGGTGARIVEVMGLDFGYNEISETKNLTGTTVATMTGRFFRVNRANVMKSGSGGVNAGNISVKSGANTIAYLPAGDSQTQQLVYTVPKGRYWLVDTLTGSLQRKTSGSVFLKLQQRLIDSDTWRTMFTFGLSGAGTSTENGYIGHSRYFSFPPKTDVKIRIVEADSNDNTIAFTMSGYLFDLDNFKY